MIGWAVCVMGALVCLANFYLSFLRYPLHRLLGGAAKDYRWVSGIPVLGSLLVATAWLLWLRFESSLSLDVAAWSLVAIDTGGFHWFLLVMAAQRIRSRGRTSA